jgi:hypothetical protein
VSQPGLQGKSYDISKRLIWAAWLKVKSNGGAAGADGVTIEQFEERLADNLYRLWNRMSSGSYFPGPVRAVEIPKKGGVIPEGAGPVNPLVRVTDLLFVGSPPVVGRVEVGGGVKERPGGRPRSGRRVLDAVAGRRTLFEAEDQEGLCSLGAVVDLSGAAPGPVSRLVDRPPAGGCRSSLRRAGGRHGALRQVRGGRDQSEGAIAPSRLDSLLEDHDSHDLRPPRG